MYGSTVGRSHPRSGSDVPTSGNVDGYIAHAQAVEDLRAAYAAIPTGTPVRLAKRTSNLFRFRPSARGQELDVSRLDRVLAVDPDTRTADVQGMVTYERLV